MLLIPNTPPMTAVTHLLHALTTKALITTPSDYSLGMLVAMLPMAFIRISHSVSYVRQFDFLNDQGGKFTSEIASISFPIRFSKVLVVIPMMLDEPNSWHEMTIRPKSISTSAFKLVSGSNNTNYPKSRNNGCWIAFGI